MAAPQNVNLTSQDHQQQPLLQAQWDQYQYYGQPTINLHASVTYYTSGVSLWRPVESSTSLLVVLDLLRDVKRLAGHENSIIQQASEEALHVAETYRSRWCQLPGLQVQLDCTSGKQNDHVRTYWIIEIARMALKGDKILCYEVDDQGVTVHDVHGSIRSSPWTTIRAFCRILESMPPLLPPQCRQKPDNRTQESTSAEGDVTRDSQQSNESQPETDNPFEALLNGIDVPPELGLYFE